ncbi:MAG: transcriptional regulator [Bacteroidales bacterium]|nr:transcriptional regulator [Bacteroidales bacterium]
MERKITLKQLEKNTAAVIFQTGIVEIGLGLIWTVSALAMLFDDISYYIDIFFVVPVSFHHFGHPVYSNSAYGLHCRKMYPMKNNENNENQQVEIDKIIHEPARLKIMAQLYVVERVDFLFLMRQTGLSQGNVSGHLSKLEDAAYMQIEKGYLGKRPQTIISLTKKRREMFKKYIFRLNFNSFLRFLLNDPNLNMTKACSRTEIYLSTVLLSSSHNLLNSLYKT